MARPALNMNVTFKANKGALTPANLDRRIKKFLDLERKARVDAATLATKTSRAGFKYLRKPDGVVRPGRSSTGGRFTSFLNWAATPKGKGSFVELDVAELNNKAPHWLIQEIGTGQRAEMHRDGAPSVAVQIRRQRGRLIPGSLVFATNGRYSTPGSARNEQLHLRSKVTGAPFVPDELRITKEIDAQHFVQEGGNTGSRQYRTQVLAAARQAFQKGLTT